MDIPFQASLMDLNIKSLQEVTLLLMVYASVIGFLRWQTTNVKSKSSHLMMAIIRSECYQITHCADGNVLMPKDTL